MQTLPGFRDFYPADCAARRYIFDTWREVARRYGFVEVDGPTLEPVELYKKKSGGELVGQLFDFVDKGERHVALRPEMTPTLARMVAAKEREFKKPLKWFSIANYFRYEKQQKGRLREFTQLNCDLIGEASPAADAEMIALAIDLMRAFGLRAEDFGVRLSSREVWRSFLIHQSYGAGKGVGDAQVQQFLAVIDKKERQSEVVTNEQLHSVGLNITLDQINEWTAEWEGKLLSTASVGENTPLADVHQLLHGELGPRGLLDYVKVDFSIVRGLAYYTGAVFEVFDRGLKSRALAGGGRYDDLIATLSDGAVKLPALGFAIGDVTLLDLLRELPHTVAALGDATQSAHAPDVFAIIADETFRPHALASVQALRAAGLRVDFPLTATKMGKQFSSAEAAGARVAVIFGAEWPNVKVKTLATRAEVTLPHTELSQRLGALLASH